MKNQIEILFSPLAEKLGWTLVHATWQFLLFALLYFAGYMLTKKAKNRYWLGMGSLLGQVLISVITFSLLNTSETTPVQNFALNTETKANLMQHVVFYLNQNIMLIVGLWALGTILLSIRLVLGYIWVNKLKNNPNNEENDLLNVLVERLKSQMNISQNVLIRTTRQVNLPMIMGIIKPVILIPAALVSGFSTAQLEAIIAHELAHLKRQDYLFNTIQSIIEIIYFFHPVMWLISAEIRKERENCCDDMTVEITQNKVLLAKTLVQLQESTHSPQLALAFGKKQYTLLERIQRIVGLQQNKNLTKESLWIVGGLLLTFFAFAQSNKQEKQQNTEKLLSKTSQSATISADTTIHQEAKNKPLNITIQNKDNLSISGDKIYLNGKQVAIPEDKKAFVQQHLKGLQEKNAELQQKTDEIQVESQKMGEYAAHISQNNEEIQKVTQKMTALSQQMTQLSDKHTHQLQKQGLSEKQLDELNEDFDKKMEELDKKMEALDQEMEAVSSKMENGIEHEVETKMEALEIPIENLSKQIDEHINAIVEVLPIETAVKRHLLEKPDRPIPPLPPVPPMAKSRKSNVAPPAPPLPPSQSKKTNMVPPTPPSKPKN